jgi:membrane associated rhomboid family serine protease
MYIRRFLGPALCRLAFCVTIFLVAGLALYPNLQLPEPQLTSGFTDKIYHVLGCALLVFLATRGWCLNFRLARLALPLSPGLELIQWIVPGRGVHVSDMMANLVGVGSALLVLWLLDRQPAKAAG